MALNIRSQLYGGEWISPEKEAASESKHRGSPNGREGYAIVQGLGQSSNSAQQFSNSHPFLRRRRRRYSADLLILLLLFLQLLCRSASDYPVEPAITRRFDQARAETSDREGECEYIVFQFLPPSNYRHTASFSYLLSLQSSPSRATDARCRQWYSPKGTNTSNTQ